MRMRPLPMRVLGCASLLGLTLVLAVPTTTGSTHGLPADGERERSPGQGLPPRTSGYFEVNRGQTDPSVRYIFRGRGFRAYLTDDGAVFSLAAVRTGEGSHSPESFAVRLQFQGASPDPAWESSLPLPGRSNYLQGNDPGRWIVGVPHCREVVKRNSWRGTDLFWRGAPGRNLEYGFRVSPGAPVDAIAFRLLGADSIHLGEDGSLRAETPAGALQHSRPSAWQESRGHRRPVEVAFRVGEGGLVGFSVGPHDPGLPLVIDPVVKYASYVGGNLEEDVAGVAAGPGGTVTVVGQTKSHDFPTEVPLQATHMQSSGTSPWDVFVSRFDSSGSNLVFSTYLGGSGVDTAYGVVVDSEGCPIFVGSTHSSTWPLKNFIQGQIKSPNPTGFVTKLSSDGTSVVFSTFLGGDWGGGVTAIALADDGSPCIAGATQVEGFPVKDGLPPSVSGGTAFVAKMAPTGDSLTWSSLYGGSGSALPRGIAVDSDGNVYVTGYTFSSNFPTVSPFQASLNGVHDAYVMKVSADGSSLVYSSYLGGSGFESGWGIAVDSSGSAWVVGETSSPDFPLENPLDSSHVGTNEAFVVKVSPSGASLETSTFLGGSSSEAALGVVIDGQRNVYVGGSTTSSDFPQVDPLESPPPASGNAFVTVYRSSGTEIAWSSLVGGSLSDKGWAIDLDDDGRIYIAGVSKSTDLATSGAFQEMPAGDDDAFVVCIQGIPPPPTGVEATIVGLRAIEVTWSDTYGDETGYSIERKVASGSFSPIVSPLPDATAFVDGNLQPSTTYTYRVRVITDHGTSEPSIEVSATTPPVATSLPSAPSGLSASATGPRTVLLSWTDNSDNEDFFVVARSEDGSLFNVLATPRLGSTSYTDSSVLPSRTYSYLVRAVNPLGSSLSTGPAEADLPGTILLGVTGGKLKDSTKARKDSLGLSGVLGLDEGASMIAVDPARTGLSLHLGDWTGQRILHIAPLDETWKVKKGRYFWKSPRGSLTKTKVKFDSLDSTFSVAFKGLEFLSPPSEILQVTLGTEEDGVSVDTHWIAKKKGTWILSGD